jgi:GTP cyclohydrolase II
MELDDWLAESLKRPGESARTSVTLSYAQSIDGSIALRRGEPLALSGPESKRMTHQLRASHDAILIGIGTVLSDDPRLNVRLAEGKDPQIVVLDSQLRTPLDAKMLKGGKPQLFCVTSASQDKQTALELAGAVVERQPGLEAKRVDLRKKLANKNNKGVKNVMVEGGGEVISSFLSESLVDRVIITVTPRLIDGYRPSLVTTSDIAIQGSEEYGEDLVLWGSVKR